MTTGVFLGAVALPGECMHILQSTVNCGALLYTSEALRPVVHLFVIFNAICGWPPGLHATVAADFGALNRVSNSPGLPKSTDFRSQQSDALGHLLQMLTVELDVALAQCS
jgi:hypothetical protein